ncbi:hypothetical protein HNQ56_001286 [Anaerotaenia torta]
MAPDFLLPLLPPAMRAVSMQEKSRRKRRSAALRSGYGVRRLMSLGKRQE